MVHIEQCSVIRLSNDAVNQNELRSQKGRWTGIQGSGAPGVARQGLAVAGEYNGLKILTPDAFLQAPP
jgi:hypothetical protein